MHGASTSDWSPTLVPIGRRLDILVRGAQLKVLLLHMCLSESFGGAFLYVFFGPRSFGWCAQEEHLLVAR